MLQSRPKIVLKLLQSCPKVVSDVRVASKFSQKCTLRGFEIGANGRDAKNRSHAFVGTLLGHPGHRPDICYFFSTNVLFLHIKTRKLWQKFRDKTA